MKLYGSHKNDFNRCLYKKLAADASSYNPVQGKKIFDTYPYFIKNKRKLRTADDLIVAISIAYSWMPTMLDMYEQSERSLAKLKKEIVRFKAIHSSVALLKKETEIKETLAIFCKATNNSVVGACKVLHLFYPLQVPIFDRRVIRAWNKLLPATAKIPILNQRNQVNCFYNYWLGILYWKENLGHTGVRRIEKNYLNTGGI
ncbi:MAG: hypothetical protein IPG86_09625 [Chitinophagaceae bacterium]|nr:hypothetical protein [Chitinophagaceae bacterium]